MIFIFDFDDTIFDRGKFKKAMERFLGRFGVKRAVFNQTYRWAKKATGGKGYDPKIQLALLNKLVPAFKQKNVKPKLQRFLKNAKKFVYPDAKVLLSEIKKEHRIILVTYGNKAWQKAKVEHSGLELFFDKIIYTDDKKKTSPLKKVLPLFKRGEAVFLEDNEEAIGAVKKKWPAILAVRLLRSSSFGGKKKSAADLTMKNFRGLLKKLQRSFDYFSK